MTGLTGLAGVPYQHPAVLATADADDPAIVQHPHCDDPTIMAAEFE